MAQRGRKPDTAAAKVARGTMKPSVEALRDQLRAPDDVPVMAPYLSDAAREVWDREIASIVSAGARRCDSAFINHTISMMADFELRTKSYQEGVEGVDAPPITMAVELRVRLEALGMAGAKTRVKVPGGQSGAKGNPFAGNGNRPRT